MRYYSIQNDKIFIAENEYALTRFYDNVLPLPEDYEEGKYIIGEEEQEINVPDKIEDGEEQTYHKETITVKVLVLNPNWEQEQAQRERERLDALYMTHSDFFDATISAFGVDGDDLLPVVKNFLLNLPVDEIQKKKAINNYKNAQNFYRKHTLFNLLSDIDIPISEQLTIKITSEQWDKFFDETSKKNPDAYKELLPKTPKPDDEQEPAESENDETTTDTDE